MKDGRGSNVVMKLMNPDFDTGHNVTTDNFSTNFSTTKKLKKHKLTIVETVSQKEVS